MSIRYMYLKIFYPRPYALWDKYSYPHSWMWQMKAPTTSTVMGHIRGSDLPQKSHVTCCHVDNPRWGYYQEKASLLCGWCGLRGMRDPGWENCLKVRPPVSGTSEVLSLGLLGFSHFLWSYILHYVSEKEMQRISSKWWEIFPLFLFSSHCSANNRKFNFHRGKQLGTNHQQ